jgi:chlorite dismutase
VYRVVIVRPLLVPFVGAPAGRWAIERFETIAGAALAPAARLTVFEGPAAARSRTPGSTWTLRGVTSNERYVTRTEHDALAARQETLARRGSTRAALIPIKKSEAWWDLAQDERRCIFEDSSRHVATGLEYLPGIARRLHHGRDLGEPFDFLTWFEFAPDDAAAFEELVQRLRATEEWTYVEREIDIRVAREADARSTASV